ncbi:MAG: hypothetical protein A2016_00200 [Elusimicrobia bacterium GWF2_62_30]|nr:MAG: hypothetical protein A2016_00200 [Elusimicrobia bacterium GWF2_62_30]
MMALKKIIAGTTAAAWALLCCGNSAFAGGGAGTSAFQFLQLGAGARPAAMGDVFAGVSGDVNSIYWNPAGLAAIERRELAMTHALWLEDITYTNIACGLPLRNGAVGVAFNVLNSGNIPEADNTGQRLGENYDMSDVMAVASYARTLGNLALGANLKYITSRIEEETAHAYAADIGALYSGFRLAGRKLDVGLSVQNAGTKARYVEEEYPLPVTARAGWALELAKGLLVASDLNYTEKDLDLRAGAEYTHALGTVILAARAGYRGDTVKELGALSGLTAGMGVKWSAYQLDYAWNSFTDLGITHRISLGIKFGDRDTDADGVAETLDKCPGTSSGMAVNAAGCPQDTDNDGVADYLDKCRGTSAGTAVDVEGCPRDADADGVNDVSDKCLNTSAGTAVDAVGCPLDADADGVNDVSDKCLNTSAGTAVDAAGCPQDADADGVNDASDKCLNTSAGTAVDAAGCPQDADADGVNDASDKCLNSSAGTAVDAAGCP